MFSSEWDKNLIYETVRFMEIAHRGQLMSRYDDTPYSCHVVNVMLNALNFLTARDSVDKTFIIQLALLHDTIEDTDVTYEDIKSRFGLTVADGVLALTRDSHIEYDLQIKDSIKRIKRQPKEVAIVKLADRLYNMRCRNSNKSLEYQEKYKLDAQLICDELGDTCPNLKLALQNAIDEY